MQRLRKEAVFNAGDESFIFTAISLSFLQYQDYMRTVWLLPKYIEAFRGNIVILTLYLGLHEYAIIII